MTPDRPIDHAFTVDVEDWFEGLALPAAAPREIEHRLEGSLLRLLGLLDEHGIKATFFWLGRAACRYPRLVRQVAAAGHELGCHGWSHDFVYRMSREEFRRATQRALHAIADIGGTAVSCYRAPFFSITRKSLWALEVLTELRVSCDSSIFPLRTGRYGIAGYEPRPRAVHTAAGVIYEAPVSMRKIFGHHLPVSGGAYFRIYPYALTHSNVAAAQAAGNPVIFYIHPWELDCGQPRAGAWRDRVLHYWNLRGTYGKLQRLLRDFSFGRLADVLDNYGLAPAAGRGQPGNGVVTPPPRWVRTDCSC